MDGFQKADNILVIGATNHANDLDPAAVRPGRFDKKIDVPKPDKNGRKDILELYLDKIYREDNVEAEKLAKMTPGFSGAEIENLVNTAIHCIHFPKNWIHVLDTLSIKNTNQFIFFEGLPRPNRVNGLLSQFRVCHRPFLR